MIREASMLECFLLTFIVGFCFSFLSCMIEYITKVALFCLIEDGCKSSYSTSTEVN